MKHPLGNIDYGRKNSRMTPQDLHSFILYSALAPPFECVKNL